MRKLKIWREGALAHMRGDAFSMTPYPTQKSTDLGWDNLTWKRSAWAAGWWWASTHRPYNPAARVVRQWKLPAEVQATAN